MSFLIVNMWIFVFAFLATILLLLLNFARMGRSILLNNDIEKSARTFGNGLVIHFLLIFVVLITGITAIVAVMGRVLQHYGSL